MNRPIVKYKKLPKLIKHQCQGYDYSLIKCKGDIAWYEARYLNGSETKGWIVVRIRRVKDKLLPNGRIAKAREILPAPKDYGRDGWFYMPKSRVIAENHFKELVAERKRGK